ncbi:MAG: decaprenyl-phosphate phosphoribosyltransferase [Streptosporangiaceae bacterium]
MTSVETKETAPRRPGATWLTLSLGVLRACRPKQWIKNVLVIAAPGTAGVLLSPHVVLDVGLAFVAFCLAASGTYLINDAVDVEADRRHPEKRHRPIAAGIVPVPLAIGVGVGCVIASLGVSALTFSWRLPATMVGYLVLTTAYTVWLKHIVVVDLVGVAAGFVLRALAGAAAAGVMVSDWFLIVASLGSLFMVAGKREAELRGQPDGATRATLEAYSHSYLSYVRAMSSGATIVTYCLWALSHQGEGGWCFFLSIVPFALAILRYAMLIDSGSGESPEAIVLRDRHLQVYGVLLIILVAIGIYAI